MNKIKNISFRYLTFIYTQIYSINMSFNKISIAIPKIGSIKTLKRDYKCTFLNIYIYTMNHGVLLCNRNSKNM